MMFDWHAVQAIDELIRFHRRREIYVVTRKNKIRLYNVYNLLFPIIRVFALLIESSASFSMRETSTSQVGISRH
jgi:hypothetical protein